jgi:hypothetical protein
MRELNQKKLTIVEDAKRSPKELIVWLYENQGEMRFDASNRFFLILVNSSNLSESWKQRSLGTELNTSCAMGTQFRSQQENKWHRIHPE